MYIKTFKYELLPCQPTNHPPPPPFFLVKSVFSPPLPQKNSTSRILTRRCPKSPNPRSPPASPCPPKSKRSPNPKCPEAAYASPLVPPSLGKLPKCEHKSVTQQLVRSHYNSLLFCRPSRSCGSV